MGHKTDAELYVFKKGGGKKRIDPHNTVLLLALDTINMGRIECVAEIKDSNISINFRAEKKEIIDFAKASFKELYDGLLNIGFRLVGMKYKVIEEKTTPFNAGKNALNEIAEYRQVIDLRI